MQNGRRRLAPHPQDRAIKAYGVSEATLSEVRSSD